MDTAFHTALDLYWNAIKHAQQEGPGVRESPTTRNLVQVTSQRVSADTIALHFRIEPGWHIYAENPGDSGLKTEFSFQDASENRVDSDVFYPPAKTFLAAGEIRTFGYENEVYLFGHGPSTEMRRIRTATTSWLACREDACVPGQARIVVLDENHHSAKAAKLQWRDLKPTQKEKK